jgi:opacity protein-like surface antigen
MAMNPKVMRPKASAAAAVPAGSLTLVRQGSYGVSGAGTSASPWRVTTTALAGDIPTWRVTGTLTVRFAFQAHEHDDDGFGPSNEFVYRTANDPVLQKNDGRSVATLGAVLVESGRNKTVDVTLSDCFFYMRRRNEVWGPHADGGSQDYEGRPSVQFFVP